MSNKLFCLLFMFCIYYSKIIDIFEVYSNILQRQIFNLFVILWLKDYNLLKKISIKIFMDKFNYLLEITSKLLGPDGCEWDRKQTFESIKKYFIEEVYELIDAIESKDDPNILEEAGDVFFLVVFLAKIAETKNKFKIDEVIQNITDKIIRRHPHVFSDVKVNSVEDILDNWNRIKKTEKNKSNRKSLFDAIPKSMPLLLKAQKIIKILDSKKLLEYKKNLKTQKEIEDTLLDLVIQAELKELDIEMLLKNKLKILLDNFDKKITGDDLKALKIDS